MVPRPPIEPPATPWSLDFDVDHPSDLIAIGADLEPGTLLAAYRAGLFPMGTGDDGAPPMGWWSPLRRGVLLRGEQHTSRSLARSARRFEVTLDRAFDAVVDACADPSRDGRWITPQVRAAYRQLHHLGWAHSIEVWDGDTSAGGRHDAGSPAGGLYGVAVGGLFAGESMFHRSTDAGKVAVRALARWMYADPGARMIDVQWQTPHLRTLGVRELDRSAYLSLLTEVLADPGPGSFRG